MCLNCMAKFRWSTSWNVVDDKEKTMSDLKDSQQTAYKFSVSQLNKTSSLRLVKMSSSSPMTCVNEQNKKELLKAIM